MTVESIRHTLIITNPSGLHMRPITAFVEAASKFQSTVQVRKGDQPPVNGKSAIHMLGLGAEKGAELILEVSGPDAREALQVLIAVLEKIPED
jgi:phosphotransferase system HPr (HPr) family protein